MSKARLPEAPGRTAELARPGSPPIEVFRRLLDWLPEGQTFAVAGASEERMVAFCCDLVVSCDVQGVLDLWRDYDEAVERPKWATRAATDAPLDRAAFQRWADTYLPPVAVRAWLDAGGKRILDSDALDILERRVAIGSDGGPVSEQVWRDAEVLSGVESLSELIGGLKSAGTKAARNEARTMANPRRASERFQRDSSIDLARRRIRDLNATVPRRPEQS